MTEDKTTDKIENEIIEELKEGGEERLSYFLSRLDLKEIERRVMAEYERRSMVSYNPVAMIKLLIYQQVRGIENKSELTREIRGDLDVAEDLGFNLSDIPDTNVLRDFRRKRIKPETRELIDYTADLIKERGTDNLIFRMHRNETSVEEPEEVEKDEEYTQDWQAYNMAQTQEKLYFKKIAAMLAIAVKDNRDSGKGRNGYNVENQIFCMLLHTYEGKSGRRTVSELEEAKQQEYIDEVPHFNTLFNFYKEPEFVSLLQDLISLTAKPLKDVEKHFAFDATGFSTNQYEEWHEARFHKPAEQKKFKKAHVASGAQTNIITAVEVTHGTRHDSPEFPKLLQRTGEHFEIQEVSADKAYSSRDNLEEVKDQGAFPFIPFKENTTGKAGGSYFWKDMYRYFQRNRDTFMNHYHLRSNSETVFSMIKQKLGTKLSHENDISQTNEILVKCLAHNIIVLIHEMHEIGFKPDIDSCAEEVLAQK